MISPALRPIELITSAKIMQVIATLVGCFCSAAARHYTGPRIAVDGCLLL